MKCNCKLYYNFIFNHLSHRIKRMILFQKHQSLSISIKQYNQRSYLSRLSSDFLAASSIRSCNPVINYSNYYGIFNYYTLKPLTNIQSTMLITGNIIGHQ
ncbi:hypothetical protein ACTFIT_009457 [Dictyostelium discoideum]